MLNIRPKGAPTEYLYSPNRDVAHCTPFYLLRAIWGMEEAHREPWFENYLIYSGITDEEVGQAAVAAARYVEIVTECPEVANSYEALKMAGFFALPSACQVILMAKLGQLFFTGYFLAKRQAVGQTRDEVFDASCVEKLVQAAEYQVARCNRSLGREKLRAFLRRTRDFFARLWETCCGYFKTR